jgi:hypothetical protein
MLSGRPSREAHVRRRPALIALLTTLGAGAALAGVPELVRGRGWKPLVQLAGAGDSKLAIERIGLGLQTLRCILHGLQVDRPTQEFVSELRDSFGDMDLEELHGLLPLSEGEWKRVRLVGRREGDRYAVRLAPAAVGASIDPRGGIGGRTGDVLAQVGVRPVAKADRTNYVLNAEVGVGIGPVGWDQITGWLEESARLAASGDPRVGVSDQGARPDKSTRLKVVGTHPGLRPEDVEVLAVLWESFPRLADVLIEVARIDDILVYDPNGKGDYQQLRLAGRLRPDLMEERYPELSEFLSELGPLMKARWRWVDAQNRQLARLSIDTSTLGLVLEGFVRDGRLLPVGSDGQVVVSEPVAAPGPVRVKGIADVTFNMNGIVTELRGLEVDGSYDRREDGADVSGRISKVPGIAVGGSAFGFLPAWAIDVVIPSNIGELTTEFLTALCRGDGGRGLTMVLRARQAAPGGAATVAIAGQAEVLNNLLIRIAFKIANQKLLPSSDVRGEVWNLFSRCRDALQADLETYARGSR